jgi:hypothetical protein
VKLARFFSSTLAFIAIPTLVSLTVIACNGDDDATTPTPTGGGDASARVDGPVRLDASCPVFVESPPIVSRNHVPEGTEITWNSNPPSSGDHFGTGWALYKEYDVPVPRGFLVHSLEHGAVALLYKCDAPPCTQVVEALRRVRDAVPTDPLCDATVRVRVIIAPDPLLDVPVAAAAWGWTYKAQCVDEPTLTQFAKDHYAQGHENLCGGGRDFQ